MEAIFIYFLKYPKIIYLLARFLDYFILLIIVLENYNVKNSVY